MELLLQPTCQQAEGLPLHVLHTSPPEQISHAARFTFISLTMPFQMHLPTLVFISSAFVIHVSGFNVAWLFGC